MKFQILIPFVAIFGTYGAVAQELPTPPPPPGPARLPALPAPPAPPAAPGLPAPPAAPGLPAPVRRSASSGRELGWRVEAPALKPTPFLRVANAPSPASV